MVLENYGVQVLDTKKIKETNGGWFWPIVAGALVYEVISDWDNFKAGIAGNAPIPN